MKQNEIADYFMENSISLTPSAIEKRVKRLKEYFNAKTSLELMSIVSKQGYIWFWFKHSGGNAACLGFGERITSTRIASGRHCSKGGERCRDQMKFDLPTSVLRVVNACHWDCHNQESCPKSTQMILVRLWVLFIDNHGSLSILALKVLIFSSFTAKGMFWCAKR